MNTPNTPQKRRFTPTSTEWPTVFVITLNWIGFGLLTFYYHQLSLLLVIPLAAYSITLYSSLQHEILHGHPTPWQSLNEAMMFPAIALWLPYSLYKETHLKHHNNDDLTDPDKDPESYYITPSNWHRYPSWLQQYFRAYNTFAGRLLFGPLHIFVNLLIHEVRLLRKDRLSVFKRWGIHSLACAVALIWVVGVCGINIVEYLAFFVYPGIALSLVRSFAEHRVAADPKHRSVVIEASPLMRLAFLNNNLHAVHHEHPGLAWYKIPAVWQSRKEDILATNGQYYFSSYWRVFSQYWARTKEVPCYSLPEK